MLRTFGKTLLALIATMMVADPLMACCFPTSLDLATTVEASATEAEKPPCHGSKSVATSESTERMGSDCPGCGDCASIMSAAEYSETLALVSSASEFELDTVNVTTLNIAANRVFVSLNIPSGLLPRIVATPVTLKLKLHI